MSSIPYIRQGSSNVRMPKDYGYVYAEVDDWAGLEDLIDPKEGDVVSIKYLPIPTGGIVSYQHRGEVIYTSEGWKLTKAEAFSKVMLDEYITEDGFLAVNGCIGIVCGNLAPTASSDYYYWSETEWLRTPDGTGYIHPNAANWGALPSDNLQAGDRVFVSDLEPGSGFAQWDGTDWRLVEGVVNTIADLVAFTGLKESGAKVTVGTGVAADPVYFWSGSAWLRTADGSHYIWPQVNNWAALLAPTPARPHAINNDEVHVNSLGPDHASGIAQMHGTTWKLIEGKWPSVSAMNTWSEGAIHSGAVAFVDTVHPHRYDENSTVYYRVGSSWVATQPAGVTKVHTITSIYDFSASGLADGDYGVLTPAAAGSSPIVLRYKAACTIAAGGFRAVWMTPTAYAGSPVLYAWTDGTENNSTLASQGWTLAIGTGCTLTPTGGYQRMATPGAQVSVSLAAMSGAISAATRVESIYECRGSIPGGSTVKNIQFYLADGVNGYSIGDSGQGGATGYGYRQSGANAVVNTPIRDVTNVRIPALAATPFVCVARDEGRTVLTSVSINGNAFADYRRSLGSITASIFYVYITGDITAPVTMDYRGQILTY